MRSLLRFAHAVDTLSEWLGKLSAILVLLVVAVGFYNVAARYLGKYIGLKLSSNIYIELQWYLYSLIFFTGFAYILKHDLNVRVDFWYSRWSPKTRTWIDLLGTLCFLIPFCILGLYVTMNPVLTSWGRLPSGEFGMWELSPDPDGLPRAPIKSMILFAFATLLLQALAQVVKYIAFLRGHAPAGQKTA